MNHRSAEVLEAVQAGAGAEAHHEDARRALRGRRERVQGRLLLPRALPPGVHGHPVGRQALSPDLVDAVVPAEQHDLLLAVQEQLDEVGDAGCLHQARGLAQDGVELLSGLQPLEGRAALLQQRAGVLGEGAAGRPEHGGSALAVDRLERPEQPGQLPADLRPGPPDHQPLAAEVVTEGPRVAHADPALVVGLRAPGRDELVFAAQYPRANAVHHVEHLAPVVIDGGSGQAHADLGVGGELERRLILLRAIVTKLLAFVKDQAADLRGQHVRPPVDLGVVGHQHVGCWRAEGIGRLRAQDVDPRAGEEALDLPLPLGLQVGHGHHQRRPHGRVRQGGDPLSGLPQAEIIPAQHAPEAQRQVGGHLLVVPERDGQGEVSRLPTALQHAGDVLLGLEVGPPALVEPRLRPGVQLQGEQVEEPGQQPADLVCVLNLDPERVVAVDLHAREHPPEHGERMRLGLDVPGTIAQSNHTDHQNAPKTVRWMSTTGFPIASAGRRCCVRVEIASTPVTVSCSR